jgi:succinoglycan biosynthesis transport protein ExoP
VNIVQFVRILWARKLLIAITAVSVLLGAFIVTVVFPPRWDASAQVLLNTLKPDPATGQLMVGPTEKNYAETQIALIKDYTVAAQVPPKLGWLTDPGLLDAYDHRSAHDVRDYRHWLAQIVIDGTKAQLLDGSNILQITFTSSDPNQAKVVVGALRDAYLTASLNLNRSDALRDASWNAAQAQKARDDLNQALSAESAYERQNGVLMADGKTDIDTARLRAMSAQGAPMMAVTPASGPTPAMDQLSQVEASLAQDRGHFGPNHPEVLALEAKRTALSALVSRERATQSSLAASGNSQLSAAQSAINAQKARVLKESPVVGRLQQLQTEVDQKQDLYNRLMSRVGELQQQASVVTSGLTPLGVATTGKQPSFPNRPLIFGGALILGVGMGVGLALLTELLGRRVRSVDDLAAAAHAPMFAVIPTERKVRRGVGTTRGASGGRPASRPVALST